MTLILARKKRGQLSQHFVRKGLRITEEEDAEAKAFKCLGEGAGAEEEGELLFYIIKQSLFRKSQLLATAMADVVFYNFPVSLCSNVVNLSS